LRCIGDSNVTPRAEARPTIRYHMSLRRGCFVLVKPGAQ
jgi:hypothetical protein